MKILLTGGAGFIATHTCVELMQAGHDVVVVCREIAQGRDVFGKEAADECRSLAVNRANDVRWVEHNGRTVEIPAESAVWLDDAPEGK